MRVAALLSPSSPATASAAMGEYGNVDDLLQGDVDGDDSKPAQPPWRQQYAQFTPLEEEVGTNDSSTSSNSTVRW